MAEVDFSDFDSAKAWFERQSPEMRSAMSCRGALRDLASLLQEDIFSSFSQEEGALFEKLALTSSRCVLISAGRGLGRPVDIEWLGSAAISAANSTPSGSGHSAISAAISAAHSTASAMSAHSAAISTRSATHSAAYSAASVDSAHPPMDMLSLPLWPEGVVPDVFGDAHSKFLDILGSDEDWAFFRRWYLAMWNGGFEDWDLMLVVARIPDEVWDAGLSKVAEAIRGIEEGRNDDFERPDNVPELQQKKLLEHVNRLLASPDMTALAAEGAAETLDRAIAQYLKEAPANCLPEEMQHLEAVPGLFRRISATVKSSGKTEAKAARLTKDIQALNAKIARLEAKLKKARAGTVQGIFTQSALRGAGGAFGLSVVGALGLVLKHLFGEWPGDMTLENLRGWLSDLESATPKPDENSLPPDYEV